MAGSAAGMTHYTVRSREAAALEAAASQARGYAPTTASFDLASQRDNAISETQLLLNGLQQASAGNLKSRQLSLAITKVEEALHWLKAIEV